MKENVTVSSAAKSNTYFYEAYYAQILANEALIASQNNKNLEH